MRTDRLPLTAGLRARVSAFTTALVVALLVSACGGGSSGGGGLFPAPTSPGTGGTPGNTAPAFTSSATTTGTVGQPYSYQATASDAEGGMLTFSLVTGPAGMSASGTGLVSWTPSAAGSYNATVRVTDGGLFTDQSWTITVTAAAGGLPASVTLTDLGALPNGMLVLSDMAEFDGKLYIAAAIAPLASPFGAGIYYYNGTSIQTAMYDSGSQGFLRAKVIDGKLYIPDGDPNGLDPGKVYIFSAGSTTPLSTNVTGAVHNFDVVKFNNQLYVSGSNSSGQSSLNRFNSATSTWDSVSTGSFGRLKYMAVLDNKIWSSKQVQSGLDGVWIDGAMTQSGFLASASGGNMFPCMEQIDGKIYTVLWGSSGVSNFIINPGSTTTTITGITGLMWDVVKHSDGNYYAVVTDGTNDKIYGSTDGVAFTQLYSQAGQKFAQPPSNADGRPSIASYNGKLYVGSSTNGRLYRLD